MKLATALNTDLDWLREHTRLLQRATEWEQGGRAANRLLSGADITAAKQWAAGRPKEAPAPTALHFDYIKASEVHEAEEQNERQRQLEERERLVKQAETDRAAREAAQADALAHAKTVVWRTRTGAGCGVAADGGGVWCRRIRLTAASGSGGTAARCCSAG